MDNLSSKFKMIKLNKLMSLILHYLTRCHNLYQKVHTEQFQVNIHYKKDNERFTEADWILQKMFENYMEKYFPTITIVGEEDTSNNLIKESEYFLIENEKEINFDLVTENDLPENLREIKDEELSIYIDPIDSTEQFIKRNFSPVTSLLGITRNEEPFVGFIYFPYYEGKSDNSLVYFNLPTKGIFCYNTQKGEISKVKTIIKDEKDWTFVSSRSRTNESMKKVFDLFENSNFNLINGLGGKSLECALNDNIFLASGTSI